MVTALKDKVTLNAIGAWRRARAIPAPVLMIPLAPVLAFFSGSLFFAIHGITGKILHFNPWVPVAIWAATLLLAVIRPLNIMTLSLLGARKPSAAEEEYLAPLWQDVIRGAGVKPGRYVLRVTGHRDVPFDRDLGPYVVTVDRKDIQLLSRYELSAVLAQRVSRQTILIGPLLAICLWALLPILLGLFLAVAIMTALRAIYRAIFSFAGDAVPHAKTEGCAWVMLCVIALGIAAFIAFIVVGAFALQYLVEAAAGAGAVAGLARLAESQADSKAIQLRFGSALASALERTAFTEIKVSGWRSIVNTSVPRHVRIARITSALSAMPL